MKALTFCLSFILVQSLSAQNTLKDKVDSIVSHHEEKGQFSGVVLVADQGHILLNRTYGYADLQETTPLTEQSVFEVASLSKSFTAMLASLFEQENVWNYQDKVAQYLPGFPYSDITIRHLLSHTSGISERSFFQWAGQNMETDKVYHNQYVLDYLIKEKPALAFEPGSRFEYSNVGYMFLASLLEKLSGQHYITLLNQRILQPLKMTQSGVYAQKHKGENMPQYAFSKVMNRQDSSWMPGFGLAWSDSIYGSVGLVSNATDLLKWDQALYSGELLKPEGLTEIFEPVILSNGKSSGYGLGWFVEENVQVNGKSIGRKASHFGLWPGYESSLVRYIEQQKTIIVISNMAPSAKEQIIKEITNILFR